MNEPGQRRVNSSWRWLRILVNFLVCLVILGGAVAAVIWINRTEPVAQKVNRTRKSAALVETVTAKLGTYSPRLVVLGTVRAAQQISLRPRVDGQVLEISNELVPGGMVKQGDLLLEIDPADFENALSIKESELAQANASMKIEEARQELAKRELKLLEGSIGEANRSLVMREPQIASMKAQVAAATAAVQRAELDLDRTKVYSPFDAQVLSRAVNVGSQVGPGDELGQLIGLDEFWIMAAVPVRSLRWVEFPRMDENHEDQSSSASKSSNDKTLNPLASGSKVILRNRDAWGANTTREARVSKLIGSLDQQTRLARVLITVGDPLALKMDAPPLILESLLETEIVGKPIENVIRLERRFIRDRDTVWVMKNEQLEIRETEIEFEDAEYAYIRSGLDDGDEVVTTTLATPAPGVGLRKINGDQNESGSDSASTSGAEARQ